MRGSAFRNDEDGSVNSGICSPAPDLPASRVAPLALDREWLRDAVSSLLAEPDRVGEWLVGFDLDALRPFASDQTLAAAFHVPQGSIPEDMRGVVLTAAGSAFIPRTGRPLTWYGDKALRSTSGSAADLGAACRAPLSVIEHADAVCLGLAIQHDGNAIVLSVVLEGTRGIGRVVMQRPPAGRDYDLLAACGVRYLGGEAAGDHFVARFENVLPLHLLNGRLAGFSRTCHCVEFFMAGAQVVGSVKEGLYRAGAARVAAASHEAGVEACALAIAARKAGALMTAIGPRPASPIPVGDLVPLGLLAWALRGRSAADPSAAAAVVLLERHLRTRAQDGLWSFQSERLPTAIDSALVLLGVDDPASVARLERFGQADGSYVPQRWGPEQTADRMKLSEEVGHWCQADLATTALVRHLRAAAGLPTVTPLSYLADQYETRSSLFVANPYLMDLLFALAIERDPDASSLRNRLAEDILGSMDDRHGFGSFDPQLSTACAILALVALGHRGRALRLAQIRLANLVNDDARRELAVPFYSTVTTPAPELRTPSVLPVGRTWQALTLYEDTLRVVGTALRARALAEHADPTRDDLPATATAHRAATPYGANGPADYVARIALPRYFGCQRSEQMEQRVT